MSDIVERLRYATRDGVTGENKARVEDRELLAQMMIRQSLATGHGDTVADLVRELEPQIERLRAELSKHQESEFHPDWSMLEATRSSLREHQQMVRALRAEVAASKDAQVDAYYCGRKDGEAEHDRLRAQVADHKAAFNKLNEVLAENLEDRKRLRAEIAKLREAADNNDAAFIDRMTVERTRLRALLRMAGAALRGIHEGRRHPQPALSIIARIDAALSKEKS